MESGTGSGMVSDMVLDMASDTASERADGGGDDVGGEWARGGADGGGGAVCSSLPVHGQTRRCRRHRVPEGRPFRHPRRPPLTQTDPSTQYTLRKHLFCTTASTS